MGSKSFIFEVVPSQEPVLTSSMHILGMTIFPYRPQKTAFIGYGQHTCG